MVTIRPEFRKLQKHSNRTHSLDVCIPKIITDKLKLSIGDKLKVSLVRKRIILEKEC